MDQLAERTPGFSSCPGFARAEPTPSRSKQKRRWPAREIGSSRCRSAPKAVLARRNVEEPRRWRRARRQILAATQFFQSFRRHFLSLRNRQGGGFGMSPNSAGLMPQGPCEARRLQTTRSGVPGSWSVLRGRFPRGARGLAVRPSVAPSGGSPRRTLLMSVYAHKLHGKPDAPPGHPGKSRNPARSGTLHVFDFVATSRKTASAFPRAPEACRGRMGPQREGPRAWARGDAASEESRARFSGWFPPGLDPGRSR